MVMTFNRIVRKEIFTDNFKQLTLDNELEFPESGIVVIYGPNGVGKSSLASVFAGDPDTEFSLVFDGKSYTSDGEGALFHVIKDQNVRNLIQGSTEDFILGDNIQREYELKKAIDKDFDYLYNSVLIPRLKSDFGISRKNSPLLVNIYDKTLADYVSDLVNIKSKGKRIDPSEFLSYIESLSIIDVVDYDKSKLDFLVRDFNSTTSVIKQVMEIAEQNLCIDQTLARVEECADAITLLQKYHYLDECVVCDNEIERTELLERKRQNQTSYYDQLDEASKGILEKIRVSIGSDDPFAIKKAIIESAISGKTASIISLLGEFNKYFKIVNLTMNNLFAKCLEGLTLVSYHKEYESIIKEKPELTNEDILFIEKFVNNCMDRRIELQRDSEGNLELLLGKQKFLNEDRRDLSLSNGEQNFISIAFELLKAKKVDAKVIVLDDPISSFDSIYKNKIVYAILKFLNNKNQILLTHNTDLIKLLEHQRAKSFNLYILNNTIGERNGFISITKNEQSLLLYLHKLIDFFRDGVKGLIKDERRYLIAMVPFMRSFSQIINKQQIKDDLTGIMHGYGTTKVNLTTVYNELFGCSFLTTPYTISVDDILSTNLEYTEIIHPSEYPMLNRALIHVLTYLYLRLKVEKTLVEKYKINTKRYNMLTNIIDKAFKEDNIENSHKRVFLLSRKTLLNEFNHFEEDLNIFQPALDITDTALKKERDDILCFLDQL